MASSGAPPASLKTATCPKVAPGGTMAFTTVSVTEVICAPTAHVGNQSCDAGNLRGFGFAYVTSPNPESTGHLPARCTSAVLRADSTFLSMLFTSGRCV